MDVAVDGIAVYGLAVDFVGVGNEFVDVVEQGQGPVAAPKLPGRIVGGVGDVGGQDIEAGVDIGGEGVAVLFKELAPGKPLAERGIGDDAVDFGGIHVRAAFGAEVDGAPPDAGGQAEVDGTALVDAVGVDDGVSPVGYGDAVACVGVGLDAGVGVADGVGAAQGDGLGGGDIGEVSIVLDAVFIGGVGKPVGRGPVADVVLGKGMVDVDEGEAVVKGECGDGVGPGRGGFGVEPIGGRLGALVGGRRGEPGLYVVGAGAVVEVRAVGGVGQVAVAEPVDNFLDLGIHVPYLPVGGREGNVAGGVAVYAADEVAVGIEYKKTEGVAALEVAGNVGIAGVVGNGAGRRSLSGLGGRGVGRFLDDDGPECEGGQRDGRGVGGKESLVAAGCECEADKEE